MNDWNLKLEAWHYLQKHQKKNNTLLPIQQNMYRIYV